MRKKSMDLPRARLDGVIHDVRPRPKLNSVAREWMYRQHLLEVNVTMCGRSFRHATLPESYMTSCMECLSMTEVDCLKFEVTQLKKDHQGVCELVAKMHAAAVGTICGPIRGPVEDVEDVRREMMAAKQSYRDMAAALNAALIENKELRLLALCA